MANQKYNNKDIKNKIKNKDSEIQNLENFLKGDQYMSLSFGNRGYKQENYNQQNNLNSQVIRSSKQNQQEKDNNLNLASSNYSNSQKTGSFQGFSDSINSLEENEEKNQGKEKINQFFQKQNQEQFYFKNEFKSLDKISESFYSDIEHDELKQNFFQQSTFLPEFKHDIADKIEDFRDTGIFDISNCQISGENWQLSILPILGLKNSGVEVYASNNRISGKIFQPVGKGKVDLDLLDLRRNLLRGESLSGFQGKFQMGKEIGDQALEQGELCLEQDLNYAQNCVKNLDLSENDLGVVPIDFLGGFGKLEVLFLEGCGLGDQSLEAFQNCDLKELNLKNNQLTNKNLDILFCSKIQKLNLSQNPIEDFFSEFLQKTEIYGLDLSKSRVGSLFVKSVYFNKYLQNLGVSCTNVKSEDIDYIIQIKELKQLFCSENGLQDEAGIKLLNLNLDYLQIENNNFSDQLKQKLRSNKSRKFQEDFSFYSSQNWISSQQIVSSKQVGQNNFSSNYPQNQNVNQLKNQISNQNSKEIQQNKNLLDEGEILNDFASGCSINQHSKIKQRQNKKQSQNLDDFNQNSYKNYNFNSNSNNNHNNQGKFKLSKFGSNFVNSQQDLLGDNQVSKTEKSRRYFNKSASSNGKEDKSLQYQNQYKSERNGNRFMNFQRNISNNNINNSSNNNSNSVSIGNFLNEQKKRNENENNEKILQRRYTEEEDEGEDSQYYRKISKKDSKVSIVLYSPKVKKIPISIEGSSEQEQQYDYIE
ncbi:hypothetical protein PPERSA_08883 [Pseudocohnilembus persalinus]|uniref:Uncharacterized protein n=1 Tax=Pseudocohnilembus persalinus TaxID=266149 RepID=A0A0V0QDV8_PSEPJ|nr:hypothetical protein PPERSA_08883 [Pseudocohnilembus persalinus]|eukprot:KRX00377.1 hypothetical protein PPERSA_08883 [Pseudocohnilembus persalinus]